MPNAKMEMRAVSEIRPYDKNAKKHPRKQVELVAKSIQEFGFAQPVVVDKQGVLIVGHGRFEAAKLLKLEEVPCITLDITEEQAKAYRLADNKLNESEWDMDLVIEELKGLENDLLEITGFDQDLILEPEDKDDAVPEAPRSPRTKENDLYELGPHRILCGDSTAPESLKKLFENQKADMMFTDPPYNVGYKGTGKNTSNGILNDKMSDSAFEQFLEDFLNATKPFLKAGAGSYVFHSHKTAQEFATALEKTGFHIDTQLIWNKPAAGLGMNDYRTKHEPFYYCGLAGEKKTFYGDRTGTTVWKVPEDDRKAFEWWKRQHTAQEQGKTTIWTMKRANVAEYVHPCLPGAEKVFLNGEWKRIDKAQVGDWSNYGCVKAVTSHYAQEIVELVVDGHKVQATGNHPFLVKHGKGIGWVEARFIKPGKDQVLMSANLYSMLKPLWESKDQKASTPVGKGTQQTKATTGYMTGGNGDTVSRTSLSGKRATVQSLRADKFTTKTAISKTIELRTSSLLAPLNTSGCTLIAELLTENGTSRVEYVENTSSLARRNGITREDGLPAEYAKNASSKRILRTEKYVLLTVGSVEIVPGKRKVWNLEIAGIPAFDTVIGVSHNTQKPTELAVTAITNSSKAGDIVFDAFLGSGTTLIAAEKSNRECYGLELDPIYVDVIVQRWCDFTGNKKIKLNGKEIIWGDRAETSKD